MEGDERPRIHPPAGLNAGSGSTGPAPLATGRSPRAQLALAGAALGAAALAASAFSRALHFLARSWRARVAVLGTSMRPTLMPGDWLLVDPLAYRRRAPRVGDLVLAPDPRERTRLLVKRVAVVAADGRLGLRGDDPAASTDSRTFGLVDPGLVAGRPWLRYWPPRRAGRVGRPASTGRSPRP